MKNDLETLFGCRSRWRIIKFFILNDNLAMTANEIKTRNKLSASESSTVIGQLVKARFLFSRLKNKQKIYYLNSRYPFYQELKNLVVKSNIYPQCSSLKRVEKLGEVKLEH